MSLIPVVHLELRYLREFSKKFEMVLMQFSGAAGKLIHEKTRSKKSRDTVPFSIHTFAMKTEKLPSLCTVQYYTFGLKPVLQRQGWPVGTSSVGTN